MSCLIPRILTLKEAIRFVPLTVKSLEGQDVTNIYKYSWSTDGVCWTSWVDYNQYLLLARNLESDFYLRVLLLGTISDLYIDGLLTTCYSICIQPQNFLSMACEDPALFNPYANLDCALLLQQQLSDAVICMLGIPIFYFRCDPDLETADFTFKEFELHNVVACKQLKLMLEDGQLPSSNPKIADYDFEWQTDWETELSKTQFARAFGDQEIPKYRDFIYVPMMKRMWQVNAAYDEKQEGLMWRSTTWKLALTKYEAQQNVNPNEFADTIDNFLVKTYQNTFEERETNEQARESGYAQVYAPMFEANNLYSLVMEDAIRESYTKDDIRIIDKIYCHKSNVVARNIYKFKNDNACVVYQKGVCGDSGMISMMLETPGCDKALKRTFANFGPIEFNLKYIKSRNVFSIAVGGLKAEIDPFGTYMLVYKWNRANYTCELSIYKHVHREDIPVYLLKPEMYWFDYDNPVYTGTEAYNNDYQIREPMQCQVYGYPLLISNIKLYNTVLSGEDMVKEITKYTTTSEYCVFNDLARPLDSGLGFAVK